MKMARKIAVLTGTRADYGLYRPLLREINSRPGLELLVVVTGMHLAAEFGYTIRDIESDGFPIAAKVDMLFRNDSQGSMAKALGVCLTGLTQAFEELQPDFLVVLGDRGEMLAGAIAAAHLGIVIAHLHGGELSGSIDDCIRHTITKFAHLHFPATKQAASILASSGEDIQRIIVAGAPGLDDLHQGYEISREELNNALGFSLNDPFILAVYHPVVNEGEKSRADFSALLQALIQLDQESVLLLPNADAGREKLIAILQEAETAKLHVIAHLPRRLYLGMMVQARLMVGNSSSGLIEAPGLGLTVVNLGGRQRGRLRGSNIIDVEKVDAAELKNILEKLMNCPKKEVANNPYRGGAAAIVTNALSTLEITPWLLRKNFTFH